ncbi:MAG: DUF4397 domain-containing protein [Calditrichia bacterium]
MKFTVLLRGLLIAAFVLPMSLLAQDEIVDRIRATEFERGVPGNQEVAAEKNVKFEETFDTTTLPAGWQLIDNDGSGAGWEFRQDVGFLSGDSIFPEAGQSFFFSSFNNANGFLIDEYIISPQLPAVESGDSLIFYAGAIDGNFPDSLRVWVSTTDSSLGSFTDLVGYFKVDGPVSSWNRYAFDMSAFAGSEPFVAINYYITDGGPSGSSSDNLWVDHVIHKGSAAANTARVQVIHNAADPGAALVDVYLNGGLLLDDFAFRDATSFIDAPAGTPIDIGVAGPNSGGVGDTLANFNVTLTPGETYVVVANGVLDPTAFAPNPDGRSTAFTLFVNPLGQEASTDPATVEFSALHGSSDAPTVDVDARGVATLVNDAAYGDITGYVGVPPAAYTLDVKDATGTVTVASFAADLSGLAGGAAQVFASGFLDPSANQNGAAFGLFAALPTGDVVEFPAITTARVQVIHNAADPAAAIVDVYLNGGLLLDDFAFRDATAFIDAPAGTPLDIGVAGPNSGGVGDTLANFTATLTAGETYVIIANGVLDPTAFAPNPDGRSTAFGLFINPVGQEASSDPATVEFAAVHGSSDAPTVDVDARGVATLVDNAAYGDITGYIGVPPAAYTLDVKDGSGAVTVASFAADLSGLAGGAATVFASGFLDPSANQNGAAFGLFAALPTGDIVEFPAINTARVQVIHNAADPGAAVVDIYLNGGILLDDFAFRDATAFIDAPAGTPIDIGVAGPNSGGVGDTLANFNVTLTPGETYVVIANGVLDPSAFAPNPDGRSTAFGLFINPTGQEASTDVNTVEFSALHGSSDAPTVDVVARGVATLVDDAAYGDITGYVGVPAASYTLDVTDASGSTVVASFTADLSGLAGGAAQVFASGFLTPSANQNGPAFGLFAALPNGDVVEFSPIVGIEDDLLDGTINNFELEQNYPNPFNPTTTIRYSIPQSSDVTVTIFNIAGQKVATLVSERQSAGAYTLDFNAAQFPSGVYFYQINAGSFVSSRKMVLSK